MYSWNRKNGRENNFLHGEKFEAFLLLRSEKGVCRVECGGVEPCEKKFCLLIFFLQIFSILPSRISKHLVCIADSVKIPLCTPLLDTPHPYIEL